MADKFATMLRRTSTRAIDIKNYREGKSCPCQSVNALIEKSKKKTKLYEIATLQEDLFEAAERGERTWRRSFSSGVTYNTIYHNQIVGKRGLSKRTILSRLTVNERRICSWLINNGFSVYIDKADNLDNGEYMLIARW